MKDVVDQGVAELGPVHIVVANAGMGSKGGPFWKIPDDQWADLVDVNLNGAWRTVKAAMPSMLDAGKGGSIILIASAAAVNTELIHNEALYRSFRPELENPTAEDVIPLLRRTMMLPHPWAEVDDIANAVAFLASDEARYITGIELPVDLGGILK